MSISSTSPPHAWAHRLPGPRTCSLWPTQPTEQDPFGLIPEANEEDNIQNLGTSASDILADSIHVTLGSLSPTAPNTTITAMFMPAEGSSPPAENQPAQGALSLVQAEAILGINHFNWVQTYSIPQYEHEYLYYGTSRQKELFSPILDPDDVSGNQSNLFLYSNIAGSGQSFASLPTDFWPYYWDEPAEVRLVPTPNRKLVLLHLRGYSYSYPCGAGKCEGAAYGGCVIRANNILGHTFAIH